MSLQSNRRRSQRRYIEAKAKGICWGCYKSKATKGKSTCAACREKARKYTNKRKIKINKNDINY